MFEIESYREIFSVIRRNKTRSFFTAFGVFWGMLVLVILMGIGNGFVKGTEHDLQGIASNSTIFFIKRTTIPYGGYDSGRWWCFTDNDINEIKRKVTDLEAVFPRQRRWESESAYYESRYSNGVTILGEFPEIIKYDSIKLDCGRFINEIDIQRCRKVCVIGPNIRTDLFPNGEDPIGKYITISGIKFQVVGAYSVINNCQLGFNPRTTIRMPFTTVRKIYNYGENVGIIHAFAPQNVDIAEKITEMKKIILDAHKDVSPDDTKAISAYNMYEDVKDAMQITYGIYILVALVGMGTLIAGIIGISNIMLVVVKERTKEFGIKRALGATPQSIINQLIIESIIITSIAGYIGLMSGIFINDFISSQAATSGNNMLAFAGVEVKEVVFCLIIMIIFAAIAGLIPALRAVRIKPIDAIREE